LAATTINRTGNPISKRSPSSSAGERNSRHIRVATNVHPQMTTVNIRRKRVSIAIFVNGQILLA
jgi:hypothetical protein